jgi:hypothetical protein
VEDYVKEAAAFSVNNGLLLLRLTGMDQRYLNWIDPQDPVSFMEVFEKHGFEYLGVMNKPPKDYPATEFIEGSALDRMIYVFAYRGENAQKVAVEPDVFQEGGIDLTPGQNGLNVQSTGSGVAFKFDPSVMERFQNATGITPVILGIQPMNMPLTTFLGIAENIPAPEVALR